MLARSARTGLENPHGAIDADDLAFDTGRNTYMLTA
jgi:hypothetical protein